jgi:murein DD-endopeptidase MepM/ murein hydrolase activator NlpD
MLSIVPALRADTIRITWDAGRVRRGGVVPLHVNSPIKLLAAEAATGKDKFPLIPMSDGTYVALVGVDLRPDGTGLPVDFMLFPARGGAPYRIRADMKIQAVKAEKPRVQKLSLPTGMVDFSQNRLQEVHRDNQTLEDSLATRSRERFWSERFLLPVRGRITTRFGTGRVLNGKQRSPHSGVDIAVKKGTPVRASNGGKVLLAESFYLSGNTVVLDHGWGVCTVYGHMSEFTVSEGQTVLRGQTIGTVGATGRATGPHLHFGAFIRGVKVDPLQLIEVTRDFAASRKIP